MKKKYYWLLGLIPLLLLTLQTFAADVTLKNGDRISGKIVDQTDDAVVVETAYAGKVRISRNYIQQISEITPDAGTAPDKGTTVTVLAEKPAAVSAPVTAPVAASKTVPTSAATAAPAPAKALAFTNPSTGFSRRIHQIATGWEGSSNIGFSYTSGNSNNITMSTGLRAAKVSPTDGMTIYVRSLWNSTHGSTHTVTTQNAFWGGARYDRNINKKVFSFISYDFERDKPKRLSFRSVAGGGLGYRMIKNDKTEFELLLGGAWNRTWQAGADTDTPEGISGLTFRQKLTERLKFQSTYTFFQNITDMHEFRFISDSNISIDVTKRVGFYIALGDRFNHDPAGTSKKNDFLFTTGLKWNFGKKK